MRSRSVQALRNHLHAIIIVPLVIIVMTWPTFIRLFDGDEFWLHTKHRDRWQQFWDAGHIERVLSGQSSLFYSDFMFHPQGASLAFYITVPRPFCCSRYKSWRQRRTPSICSFC